jgi:MFS family permease
MNDTAPRPLETVPTSPFAYPDFNRLMMSRLMAATGMQMLTVAIGWHIYELTRDPFAIGITGFAQFAPSLLLVLLAGHVADQVDRARVLAASHLAIGLAAAGLLAATLMGRETPAFIYAMCALIGVGRVFGAPAGQAILPNIVPGAVLSRAIAYNSTTFQVAVIGGPALAGLILLAGADVVYGVAALLLALAALNDLLIRTRSGGARRPLTLDSLMAGLHFIRARPTLLGAMSLDLFAVLLGSVVALLPIYARDILQVGPSGLGLMRSAPAIGAAAMALVLGRQPLQQGVGKAMLASTAVFGLATIAFGVSTSYPLSLALLATLGAADMISVYVRTHLVQTGTPDEMRGRVSSVNMLFITASNELGDFESGFMAGLFGTVPAVVIGGVLSVVTAGLIAWRVPELRRLERFEPSP